MEDFSGLILFYALVVWVGGSIMVGRAAGQRGRDNASWFFLSLFFSPLLAAVCLCATPVRERESAATPAPVEARASGKESYYSLADLP